MAPGCRWVLASLSCPLPGHCVCPALLCCCVLVLVLGCAPAGHTCRRCHHGSAAVLAACPALGWPCRPPQCPGHAGRGKRCRWHPATGWAAAGSPRQSCGRRRRECRGQELVPVADWGRSATSSSDTSSPPGHLVQHIITESQVWICRKSCGLLCCHHHASL